MSANSQGDVSHDVAPNMLIQPPETSPISKVPTEILQEILSYCVDFKPGKLSPLLTCKQWYPMYQVLILKDVVLDLPSRRLNPKRNVVTSLLDLLHAYPYLQTQPRSMRIMSHEKNIGIEWHHIIWILNMCSALRSLTIYAYFTDKSDGALRALGSLHCLEHLSLYSPTDAKMSHGVSVEMLKLWDLTSLKSLRTSHCNSKVTAVVRYGIHLRKIRKEMLESDLNELLPLARCRTGNLHTMSMEDLEASPMVLERLLQWPRQLKNLAIFYNPQHPQRSNKNLYTAEVNQRLINIHRVSLESIWLGYSHGNPSPLPDFSSFPVLKHLRMPAWNVVNGEGAVDVAKKICAPKLQLLSLSFTCVKLNTVLDFSKFGKVELLWMKDFAHAIRTLYPLSQLRKIQIFWAPNRDPRSIRARLDAAQADIDDRHYIGVPLWPYRYLERAKRALSGLGFVIEYVPTWTKEEWEHLLSGPVTDETQFEVVPRLLRSEKSCWEEWQEEHYY